MSQKLVDSSWTATTVLAIIASLTLANTTACEVDLGGNLALNRPTQQSSTNFGGASSRVVDGNRDVSYWGGKSCSHTKEDFPTWWQVDLQITSHISSVQITNVNNQYWKSLRDFTVEVSLQPPSSLPGFPGLTNGSSICVFVVDPTPSGQTKRYVCPRPLRGRYIRIVKYNSIDSERPLVICEFEAFGEREWNMQIVDSGIGSPQILHVVPGRTTSLGCARCCLFYQGGRACRFFQYHLTTGVCQLLVTSSSDKALDSKWELYRLVE